MRPSLFQSCPSKDRARGKPGARSTRSPCHRPLRYRDLSCYNGPSGGASMKRRAFICVLGSIASGFWPRRRTIIAAMAATVLLPIGVSDAGWLSDLFKGSSKQAKSPKQVSSRKPATLAKPAASPKHRSVKLAALGPVHLPPAALKPVATRCDTSKFRIVLDVGHNAESEGAISARNVSEFVFNLRLAKRIEEKLKAEGFAQTSGPNLTLRFAWGFPEGLACASLGDARANEHPIE